MDTLIDHVIQTLTGEWAVMSAHREAFLAVLGIGLFFGWTAAWLILRQRLSHHKDLVDHYQQVVAEKIPAMSRPRALSLGRMLGGVAILLLVTIGPLYILLLLHPTAPTITKEGARFVLNPGPLNRETKTVEIAAINKGDVVARASVNGANEIVYAGHILTEQEENEWYEKLKATLVPIGTGIEFLKEGGRTIVIELPTTDAQFDDVIAKKTYLYVFFLIAFTDETTPPGQKFLASLCVRYQGKLSDSKVCFGHNETRQLD
jgi:hypothetical protein